VEEEREQFGRYLSNVVEQIVKKDSPLSISRAVLPYEELKEALYEMDPKQISERAQSKDLESCPICLEDFQSCTEAVYTGCGHAFHGSCLACHIRLPTSNNSKVRNCPMCRASEKDMAPVGHDGAILEFLLILWDAIQNAERMHARFVRIVNSRMEHIKELEAKLWSIEKVVGTRRHKALNGQIRVVLHMIQAAQLLVEANSAGFRRILTKFQQRAMDDVSPEFFRRKIAACHFTRDFEPGGRLQSLRDELLHLDIKANRYLCVPTTATARWEN